MIFVHSYVLSYQEFNETISNDARLWKPINIQNGRHF